MQHDFGNYLSIYKQHHKRPEDESTFKEVCEAVSRERNRQQRLVLAKGYWEQHTVGEWILVAQKKLADSVIAWVKHPGDDGALGELLQTAAVIVACLEQHGIVEEVQDSADGQHS